MSVDVSQSKGAVGFNICPVYMSRVPVVLSGKLSCWEYSVPERSCDLPRLPDTVLPQAAAVFLLVLRRFALSSTRRFQ
ncbi:hypothetical protein PG995_004872 [Apiospora arundinis]|uniref:Uncharacterized protein n=1 Tax=Apiospora arundinis TaxID=335852 RepID=A0ABR2IXR3_9PEZI